MLINVNICIIKGLTILNHEFLHSPLNTLQYKQKQSQNWEVTIILQGHKIVSFNADKNDHIKMSIISFSAYILFQIKILYMWVGLLNPQTHLTCMVLKRKSWNICYCKYDLAVIPLVLEAVEFL